jgi:hypothetical protein
MGLKSAKLQSFTQILGNFFLFWGLAIFVLCEKQTSYSTTTLFISRLEYIYFMKIGQPKLSETKNYRSGVFVRSIYYTELDRVPVRS